MSTKRSSFGCGVVFAILAIIALLWGTYGTVRNFTGVYVKPQIDRGNTYFVIEDTDTAKKTVYENEDSIFFLKFNSGDLLMELEQGKTYRITANWFRVPLFSWYPCQDPILLDTKYPFY